MWIQREGYSVRVWTPAKVNLFLEVLGRRSDGYHDLNTLMVTVGLFDTLHFREQASQDIYLTCDHPGLSVGPENLVHRAARLLRERFDIRSGVAIHLAKRIPTEAGLAGGSSDAAATLAGLNRLWRLGLRPEQLATLGAELGSDVAFFFHGPAAWCTGRGEIIEPMTLGSRLYLVLCCPRVGLSTASVFRALRLDGPPRDGGAARRAAEKGDIADLGMNLYNRLEEPAMRLCPEVAGWRERLARLRPAGARMSGSGSTLFALANDAAEALRLARALASQQEAGCQARVFVVRSCD